MGLGIEWPGHGGVPVALGRYDFDDSDWQAIEHGSAESSWEPPERWYDYPIAGVPELIVSFARDENAGLIGLRVSGDLDEVLEARVETLLTLFADRRLR